MRFSTLATAVLAFATLAPVAGAQSFTRAGGSSDALTYSDVKVTELPASSSLVTTTITQNTSQTIGTGAAGAGVACPTPPNSILRRFDLSTFALPTGIAVTSVGFGIESIGTPGTSTLNIYRLNGAFTTANLTLVGTASVPVSAADDGTIRNVPITGTFAATDVLVVEWATTGANNFFGGNSAGQTGPTYIKATACGAAEPADLATLGFASSHWVVNVTGETTPPAGASLTVTPTSVAFGTVTNGQTATRTVVITNNGTAAANISAITLTGSPAITATGTAAGTLAPGASRTVTLTFSPTAANSGPVTASLSITSNAPGSPITVAITGTGDAATRYASTDTPLAIPDGATGAPGSVVSTIIVPATVTGTLTDLNIDLNITHTYDGDLGATLAKGATSVVMVDRPGVPTSTFGCSGDNMVIILDDQNTLGPVETSCVTGASGYTAGGRYSPNNPLSAFNAMPLAGTWTLTITDAAAGDTGTLNSWALLATVGGTAGEGSASSLASRLSVAPNPMRGASQIDLTVGTAQDVRVALYDALGREVAVLLDRSMTAGQQAFVGVNTSSLPTGVYVVRATGTDLNLSQRVTVVR